MNTLVLAFFYTTVIAMAAALVPVAKMTKELIYEGADEPFVL